MEQIQEVPIGDVKPYENNPRDNDGGVDAVANSIKEFGWQQPIVVGKDNVIIVGHTRYKAAKKLGMKEVPVVVADKLSDEQVKAYRLADNKTGELTDWDDDLLNNELSDILDIDMSDFGFGDDDDLGADLEDDNQAPEANIGSLSEDFIVPPFSIINLSKREVLDRKAKWNALIQDDGTSRGGAKSYENKGFTKAKYGTDFENKETSIMNPVVCELINRWFLPTTGKQNTFDCFAGDTAFGFVSSYLGNHFTGVELRQQQVDFNQSRCDEEQLDAHYICDDGQNIAKHLAPESQDLLFSCPPYFDLEVYSDDPNDASNQDSYEDFLAILDNAFTNATKCLKK